MAGVNEKSYLLVTVFVRLHSHALVGQYQRCCHVALHGTRDMIPEHAQLAVEVALLVLFQMLAHEGVEYLSWLIIWHVWRGDVVYDGMDYGG